MYDCVYADPPWKYKDTLGSCPTGAAKYYQVMTTEEICALPVSSHTARDACLFIWGTWPLLFDTQKVIEAWGFKYKTCAFIWVKANRRAEVNQARLFADEQLDDFLGMGSWTRTNSEFCLLATKGKPKRKSASVRQVIYEPCYRHSEKPEEARLRIEALVGVGGKMLEMFARKKSPGWDVFGNEVESIKL